MFWIGAAEASAMRWCLSSTSACWRSCWVWYWSASESVTVTSSTTSKMSISRLFIVRPLVCGMVFVDPFLVGGSVAENIIGAWMQ